MPHLVLIDGPNYVFRAFHAVRHLSNSRGEPTNAVFGYVQMLRSVLDRLKPTHVAVAFDPKDGSFRNAIYPEYKAHRPPMPQELAMQWPRIWEITRAFRFPLICLDNYEADDVITTLARRAAEQGWEVTIVSSDKDLMQLIGGHIHMLDTMKNVTYDAAAVHEKWGVPPERIRDLLALVGDSSDNIPGVPGIGPKTAAELLASYQTLDGVLDHAGEIKQPKRRESLLTHADKARLAFELVGLCDTVPVTESLEDLALGEPDRERLAALFGELEFRRLSEEFGGDAPPPAATRPSSPPLPAPATPLSSGSRTDHVVDDEDKLAGLVARLQKAALIAIDTETTSLNTHDAEIVGLSFAVSPGEAWYVPVGHRAADMLTPAPKQLPRQTVLAALKPLLEDASRPKCGHNLKYDTQVLRRAGIRLTGIHADSMLLAYCLYPGRYPPKLDHVAAEYLGHRCISYEQVAGKGAKQISFAEVPLEAAVPYACEDAEVAFRLTALLRQRLSDEGRLNRHDDIELPLSHVLADMEWTGTRLDRAMLARLSNNFGERIRALEARIHAAAGQAFNIQSPKQLGELLYETLNIPGGKKTKSGQWATDQSVLEKLAEEHEVPRLILESRQLAKLKSTYTDALQALIYPVTGRVHTSYNQAITSTGRLSSSDPNLQNIPIRSDEGREIRKAFVAEDGHVLISADYSQIELRLMAHFSGDAQLATAFARGEDIHAATAAAVNQVPLANVTGEMRRRAKAVNFGILYGMSAFGLARQLGMERGEAQMFIDAYFRQYPGVRAFMDATLETARAQGYVETLLGHRVYVPDIMAKNGMNRQYAERTAINAPLQGSAADIIKVAMIRLHERLAKELPAAGLILQVHDELVVEAPADQALRATEIIRHEMEQAMSLHVPLTVDIGTGPNWFEAHRL
ncbi:MAG TPA: DNA polymerase I [Mariprofundaceae bacterium]|nr:DNA polymerase I [Mariprofundaceae bacterium]